MTMIRILFLADTHLGFDMPFRPRIKRRRRGPDFFENFEKALEPAYRGEVDLVIHGGDLLYRSKVPAKLVQMAFEPLIKAADSGIPVYVVPGNHERSVIPYRLLAAHRNIHIFDKPQTYVYNKNGKSLVLAGFPYERKNIRESFRKVLKQTGWENVKADGAVLCLHHCVEGAVVGPKDYTFRYNEDVIRINDIPDEFAAALSGHIHRFQVLDKDLKGNPVAVPVFYPGSIERTSFAEITEKKGYLTIDIDFEKDTSAIKDWNFHELPARPMIKLEFNTENATPELFREWLRRSLSEMPEDSIVRISFENELNNELYKILRAESMRKIAPETMNIEFALGRFRKKT
ncbi:MAG: hypothetical protein GY863_15050 [bacterium]|nr:hypothetical protein [bacterium]